MKKLIQKIILSALLVFISWGSFLVPSASAHDLVPKALIDYVQSHPNATPAEIQAYAEAATPNYAEKYPSGAKVIELIRSQKSTSFWDTTWDFLKLGIVHILSGPDHILFVISLLLAFVSLREILKLTSAFTVAHTITLILSSLGAIALSSRIVEPMIALSIAVVALGTVYLKQNTAALTQWRKLGIVFFFGLFHGLGFAGLLRELGVGQDKFVISLFSFNIGIEIGQLIIIAVVLPILLLLRKTKYHEISIKVIGTVIGVIGLLWALERALGWSIGWWVF